MLEMRIVLREVLRAYELRATVPGHERPRRKNITITPGRGSRVGLPRRARTVGGGMTCIGERTEGQRLVHDVTRRLVVLGWLANAIGAAGVFMAVGFLVAVFFGATDSATSSAGRTCRS